MIEWESIALGVVFGVTIAVLLRYFGVKPVPFGWQWAASLAVVVLLSIALFGAWPSEASALIRITAAALAVAIELVLWRSRRAHAGAFSRG